MYPDQEGAKKINDEKGNIHYKTEPVDATDVDKSLKGLRTMVSGFHHLKPKQAKQVLQSASDSKQPICIFEISDNSHPKAIWWLATPFNLITCLFVTLLARPITWQQLVFTYLIPIIPIAFAWDGAVSNARTYTLDDLDLLLKDVDSEGYTWKKGIVKGKSKKIYLIGKAL
ncbi:hypothetical protein R9C00_17450 [Flammeovirgaceae bacterium SG7u.111]|nr:hypothetical protein [Flammeovirgaceae bacterium SG7u.132]WPO33489.1 hypothetical protein R9C00_17450 [Flammeovirgaceae bacterium SG7u.111]